jgi:mevalonate kinase
MDSSLSMFSQVSVPGKVILAGEHAVVYGYPALVAAIDRRLHAKLSLNNKSGLKIKDKTKDRALLKEAVRQSLKVMAEPPAGLELEIESEIPVGCGLGSSAALATAIVWLLLKNSPQELKDEVIKRIEDWQHGKSSGVDQTVVREGGILRFQKSGKLEKTRIEPIKLGQLPEFFLVNSGRPKETTGEMVGLVAERLKTQNSKLKLIFRRMGAIAQAWQLDLIKENQRLLEAIGVVGDKAKKMVRQIELAGGLAKVCGAGGLKQGSGMLLVYHPDSQSLKAWLRKKDWQFFPIKLGGPGARYE